MADNVIRTISFRGTSEGLDKLTADLRELAAEEKNVAVVSDDLTKRQISLAAAWKQTGLRLNETARAQDNYARLSKQSADLLKQEGITDDQHKQRLKELGERYGLAATASSKLTAGMSAAGDADAVASQRMVAGMSAMGKEAATTVKQIDHVTVSSAALTKQSSRNAAEMLNLGRQFADVAVSMQAGQSIVTVGVQQLAQIIDVFASSNRSAGQIFSQAIGWATGFVRSTAGVITGIAAIGATAVAAGMKFEESQADVRRALAGTGRAAQLTATDIGEIAKQASSVHGLSAKEAQEAASVFAATGKMYRENITAATSLTHDFATALGVDTVDAAKMLAEGLTTGIAGIDKLDAKYNFLTASQREYLKDLDANVDKTKFQAAAIDMLSSKMVKANQITTNSTQGWTVLGNVTSNVFRAIGEVTSVSAPTKDMTAIKEQIQALEELRDVTARTTGMGGGLGAMGAAKAAEEVEKLSTQIANLNLKLTELEGKQLAAKFGEIGKQTMTLAEAFTQSETKAKELERALEALTQARAMPEVTMTMSPDQPKQLDRAIDAAKVLLDKMKQTADETARANANGLQLKETYGTTTIEAARTLDALKDQANVAGAVGGAAQMAAQEQARYNQLIREGKDAEDASRIAAAERLVTQNQINSGADQMLFNLKNQAGVAGAVGGAAKMAAQEQATYNSLVQQGVDPARAAAVAAQERANTQAQINAKALENLQIMIYQRGVSEALTGSERIHAQALATQNTLIFQGVAPSIARATAAEQEYQARAQVSAQLKEQAFQLNQQAELIEARTAGTEAGLKAEHAYVNALRAGASQSAAAEMASAVQRQEDAQAAEQAAQRTAQAAQEVAQANREAAREAQRLAAAYEQAYQSLKFMPFALLDLMAASRGTDIYAGLYQSKQGGYSQFNPEGYVSTYDPLNLQQQKATMEKRARETGGTVEEVQHGVGLGAFTSYRIKLNDAIDANTNATKENTAATQTMTDVLSPFYSSDPRRTHLGFRSFAGGGIMTAHGELPLKHYQSGGVATSPQVAVYGEGSTPEAYVPVPSGRIPVEIKQPANSNQRPINVTINVAGNADANTVAALKSTAFQQAQSMRRALG